MARKPAPAAGDFAREEARFAALAKDFVADKRVTVGKLFASNGLKVGGKIFAMVVKGKLVVKLPKARVDALVATGNAEHFDPGHGRPMKEWAAIPATDRSWKRLAREAFDYVGAGVGS